MAQIDYIKDLYENEDLSLREISRRTGHSFQTVQKYAYQEDWSGEKLPNLEAENHPMLEKYIPSIDEWMEEDRKVTRKQRHTAMRIYHRLQEELGYSGSYSSVRRYVSKKKLVMKLAAEGCLPLAQPKGEGQVDQLGRILVEVRPAGGLDPGRLDPLGNHAGRPRRPGGGGIDPPQVGPTPGGRN